MKVVITGGHFSPALAVIDLIQPRWEVLVIGRKHALEGDSGFSFEYVTAQKLKIPFKEIIAARIQRVFTRHTMFSFAKFPIGLFQAFFILREYRPDVVLVFGGYVAVPVSIASFFLDIPIVVHEQTQRAGFANRCIALFAKKVCISFSTSQPFFPKQKIIYTGNPVRKEVFVVKSKLHTPAGIPIIYVTGGGAGAHFINEKIRKILPKLVFQYVVIHQVGDSRVFNDYERLVGVRNNLPKNLQDRYIVKKFIFPDQIGWVMRRSDLIISRSGINTACELIALSKKCLLIPLVIGQDEEQLANAQLAKQLGIAEVLLQEEATEEKLYDAIERLLLKKSLKINHETVSKYNFIHAAKNIVEVLNLVYEKSREEKN